MSYVLGHNNKLFLSNYNGRKFGKYRTKKREKIKTTDAKTFNMAEE